ncbi:hypothetical protein LXL04_016526 [Taraxacum kok-saghyz]
MPFNNHIVLLSLPPTVLPDRRIALPKKEAESHLPYLDSRGKEFASYIVISSIKRYVSLKHQKARWTEEELKLDIEIDQEQLQKLLSSLVQMVVSFGQFKGIKVRMQIRKMDLEARNLQPNVKVVLLAKLSEYNLVIVLTLLIVHQDSALLIDLIIDIEARSA